MDEKSWTKTGRMLSGNVFLCIRLIDNNKNIMLFIWGRLPLWYCQIAMGSTTALSGVDQLSTNQSGSLPHCNLAISLQRPEPIRRDSSGSYTRRVSWKTEVLRQKARLNTQGFHTSNLSCMIENITIHKYRVKILSTAKISKFIAL